MSARHHNDKSYNAWLLLRITYTLAPILVGLDKLYMSWLVNWTKYTNPLILQWLPITSMQFVVFVGIVEIIAGIIVWFWPRFGGYLVALWLVLIIINLASMNQYFDIIARDAMIAIGAIALAWLS